MMKVFAAAVTLCMAAAPAEAQEVTLCTDGAGNVWGGLAYDAVNDPVNVMVVSKAPLKVTATGHDWQGQRPEDMDTIKGLIFVDKGGAPSQMFSFHVGTRARMLKIDLEGTGGKITDTISCAIPRP